MAYLNRKQIVCHDRFNMYAEDQYTMNLLPCSRMTTIPNPIAIGQLIPEIHACQSLPSMGNRQVLSTSEGMTAVGSLFTYT
jgi:hypothetical protein